MTRRLLLLQLASLAAVAQITAPPSDLDQWVARAMQQFEIPGAAVAIVKDGKTVFEKGYGVRRLGSPERVDEHTLFGIASNTKAFTTAALAMLVEDGKLQWDDPVQAHLPGFQAYDPYVSRELRVDDLVSHRSGLGLGAGDLLFWPDTDVSRSEVVAAARHIRPASSFRSKYAYNNLAFVVAGEVVHKAAGKPWDDFIRERIFAPLGMSESRISAASFKEGENIASPHSRGWRLEGTLRPIPGTLDETWAAAAGIKSNVHDLSKWVAVQLKRGEIEGDRRLWSASAAEQMWSPRAIIPISEPPAPLKGIKPNFAAYGLGWSLRDYQGRKIVSHGGALTGMLSATYMIPEEQLGIVVLTNQEEGGAISSIVYHLLDHYLGLKQTDWIDAFAEARKIQMKEAAEEEAKLEQARAKDTRPSLPLVKYEGEYHDPWYGKAAISAENGGLVLRMSRTPAMVADLKHWHHDTFQAAWRDNTIPDAFVTFALDYKGGIDRMTMQAASSLADFSFDYHDLLFRPAAPPDDKEK